jgi:hypothetical protein
MEQKYAGWWTLRARLTDVEPDAPAHAKLWVGCEVEVLDIEGEDFIRTVRRKGLLKVKIISNFPQWEMWWSVSMLEVL